MPAKKPKSAAPSIADLIREHLSRSGQSQAELIRQLEPILIEAGLSAATLSQRLSAVLSAERRGKGDRTSSLLVILGGLFRVTGVDPRVFFNWEKCRGNRYL